MLQTPRTPTFRRPGGSGFPRPFDAFANALQFASLDIFSTLHIDCAANTNYVASLVFATTAPLVPIALVNMFRCGDTTKLRKPYKYALMVLFYLLPTTSTTICRAMACENFEYDFDGDETRKWMVADLSIRCSDSDHKNPTYDAILAYACVMILIYPIGIPLIFTLLMWRNREAIKSRKTAAGGRDINHLEFLFSSYDPKYVRTAT